MMMDDVESRRKKLKTESTHDHADRYTHCCTPLLLRIDTKARSSSSKKKESDQRIKHFLRKSGTSIGNPMALLFSSFSTSMARRSIKATCLSSTTFGRCGYASTTALRDLKPVKLHTEWIEGPKEDGNLTILFLHGLLGNGRNLKTFARKLVKQQSKDGSCGGGILMDLRGHGSSFQKNSTENVACTFQDCAQDVHHTLQAFHAEESVPPTGVLVGHSFGGRLALEYAATIAKDADPTSGSNQKPLKALWLLDTVPGEANASVDKVLAIITNVLEHQNKGLTKKDMVQVLTDPPHNMDLPTAQWLAMSYDEKSGDNFGFDNDLVTRLKPEFANQAFMGLLKEILESNKGTKVHIVRGGKNEGWTIPILSELQKLSKEYPSTFHLHVLPSAGHNVHIDDLPGLLKLFAER